MKKYIIFTIFSIVLIGCVIIFIMNTRNPVYFNKEGLYTAFEDLPNLYSKEEAIKDNCVVYENNKLVSGEEIWKKFIRNSLNGRKSFVRIATILDNEALIGDLVFTGNEYSFYARMNNGKLSAQYKHILEVSGKESSSGKTISYVIMCNEKNITYSDVSYQLVGSNSEIKDKNNFFIIYLMNGVS